jgi:TM2 domain-containing membrane protein YozV
MVDFVGAPLGSEEIRVGTAERESAVQTLGDHFAAGRLGTDEYEERVSLALEAKTRGDLRPLFRDLPEPYPAFMAPPARARQRLPEYRPDAPSPVEYSDKSRIGAGVLQLLLPFGIGRFYTGHTNIALAQLLTSFMFIGVVWSWIDGITLLTKGGVDAEGRELRD